MSTRQVTYDFDRGETYDYSVISATDIDLYAQSKPGLYAWYLRVLPLADPAANMELVDKVFASKQLDVQVQSNLGEVYKGKASKKPLFDGDVSKYHSSVLAASVIFSPPVYIGISKDIRVRLGQHKRALQSVLQSNQSDVNDEPVSDDDNDTQVESNAFGKRMGVLLKTNGVISTRPLFVKVIYCDQVASSDLRKSESYVNRVFFLFVVDDRAGEI